MASSVRELACNIALEQLARQKEDLRSIRNQASFSAAISGLIATVFSTLLAGNGSRAFKEQPDFLWFSIEGWLVIVAFAGSIAFAVQVVVARMVVNFEISAEWILGKEKNGDTLEKIRYDLATFAEEYFDENEIVIAKASQNLLFSLIFSWAQIPAWLLLVF